MKSDWCLCHPYILTKFFFFLNKYLYNHVGIISATHTNYYCHHHCYYYNYFYHYFNYYYSCSCCCYYYCCCRWLCLLLLLIIIIITFIYMKPLKVICKKRWRCSSSCVSVPSDRSSPCTHRSFCRFCCVLFHWPCKSCLIKYIYTCTINKLWYK